MVPYAPDHTRATGGGANRSVDSLPSADAVATAAAAAAAGAVDAATAAAAAAAAAAPVVPVVPAGGDASLQGALTTMTYISEACRVRWPIATVRPVGSIAPQRLLTGIGSALVGFRADRLLFVAQGD